MFRMTTKNKAIIYSTKTYPWCRKTKEFFKANKISFIDKDVGDNKKNADEMIKKSGQYGVPVTIIGKKIIVGYDIDEIKKALEM
jgi:glutaredoxin 3